MTAQCVFQFLQKGNLAGLSRSQTLLILKNRSHCLTLPTVTECKTTLYTEINISTNSCHVHQNGDDAFVLLFYQVTNDLVVKVLHRLPLKLEGKIWRRTILC